LGKSGHIGFDIMGTPMALHRRQSAAQGERMQFNQASVP
jgi:hypothetical protein